MIPDRDTFPSRLRLHGIVFWNEHHMKRVLGASESIQQECIQITKVYPRSFEIEECYSRVVLL